MEIVWIVVSLVLAGSLMLPRAWLHAVGIVGCSLLLWHAIELGDPPFVIVQIAFLVVNVAGLVACGVRRKLANLPRSEIERITRYWNTPPHLRTDAQKKYWTNN